MMMLTQVAHMVGGASRVTKKNIDLRSIFPIFLQVNIILAPKYQNIDTSVFWYMFKGLTKQVIPRIIQCSSI